MNAAAFNHPKLLEFAAAVREYLHGQNCPLPPETAHVLAAGMVDALWRFATQYAPAGDVGKHRDGVIARAVGWMYDADWLIEQWVALRLLDRDATHRLIVHDWSRHCDRSCHQHVADEGIRFADGRPTMKKPRRGSPADVRQWEQEERDADELERMAYELPPSGRDSFREVEPPSGASYPLSGGGATAGSRPSADAAAPHNPMERNPMERNPQERNPLAWLDKLKELGELEKADEADEPPRNGPLDDWRINVDDALCVRLGIIDEKGKRLVETAEAARRIADEQDRILRERRESA